MQKGQLYGRENDMVIVMRGRQESKTHFLFIYLIDSKKAWHYSFEFVMISEAELIPLPFYTLKFLIFFNHHIISRIVSELRSVL